MVAFTYIAVCLGDTRCRTSCTTTPFCPYYTGSSAITANGRSLTRTLPSIILTEYVHQLMSWKDERINIGMYITRIVEPVSLATLNLQDLVKFDVGS